LLESLIIGSGRFIYGLMLTRFLNKGDDIYLIKLIDSLNCWGFNRGKFN